MGGGKPAIATLFIGGGRRPEFAKDRIAARKRAKGIAEPPRADKAMYEEGMNIEGGRDLTALG